MFAFKAPGKAQRHRLLIFARHALEDGLARFAIADFQGVHDARANFSIYHNAIHQREDRLLEVQLQQRFGRRKLHRVAVLVEAIETLLAQLEETFF